MHADSFILKGATLFAVWAAEPHRPTKDVDLLGFGAPETERLLSVFRDVIAVEVESDGLTFNDDSLKAAEIREKHEYDGIRVTMTAMLGTARIPNQVDVGFGDATGVPLIEIEFPTLLDEQSAPIMRAYSREVVIAEKFHAIVDLGMPNTRMKDYYDILALSRHFAFDGRELELAIAATFERRGTEVPSECPDGLHDDFGSDREKTNQWRAFLRRTDIAAPTELVEVVAALRAFLMPVAHGKVGRWEPGGPWGTKPP